MKQYPTKMVTNNDKMINLYNYYLIIYKLVLMSQLYDFLLNLVISNITFKETHTK